MGETLVEKICSKAPSHMQHTRLSKLLVPKQKRKISQIIRSADMSPESISKSQLELLNAFSKESMRARVTHRNDVLKYVHKGLFEHDCSTAMTAFGQKSMMMPVTIPTYRYFDDPNDPGFEIAKTIRLDYKLRLDYGLDFEHIFLEGDFLTELGSELNSQESLRTYVDFVLTDDTDKSYFVNVLTDLRRYDEDRFKIIDKVGKDLFNDSYGGFIIFTPLDDPTVNVEVNFPAPTRDFEELISFANKSGFFEGNPRRNLTYSDLNRLLTKERQSRTIRFKKKRRDKIAEKILAAFPETASIVGLPYKDSTLSEYFLDVKSIFGID